MQPRWLEDGPERRLRQACNDLDRRVRAGEAALAEEWLSRDAELAADPDLAVELIYSEFLARQQRGDRPDPAEYDARFPQWADQLRRLFQVDALLAGDDPTPPLGANDTPGQGLTSRTGVNWSASWLRLNSPVAATLGSAVTGDEHTPLPQVPGFELLEERGRGGMGVVYRARDLALNRMVAIKMLLGRETASAEQRVRFLVEAEMVARVRHPHVVEIFEIGNHAGSPFFVLEYIDGESLQERLKKGRLEPRGAAELVEVLARTVHFAHQRGVVHRDIKPANILLERRAPKAALNEGPTHGVLRGLDAIPKITDFGLARRFDVDAHLTQTGHVVGTPVYMAPEQARGGRNLTPAVDIYSLGAVLYELLAGRPPYKADNPVDTLLDLLNRPPDPLRKWCPTVPRDLEIICQKCLERDPTARYATAGDLADDLLRFLNDEPIAARPVSVREHTVRWCRRHPLISGLVAALVVSIGAGLAATTTLYLQAAAARDQAAQRAQEAEANLALARRAVNECYTLVTEDPAFTSDRVRAARLKVLERALPFYQGFRLRGGEDAEVLKDLAENQFKLGCILVELGRVPDADQAYRHAEEAAEAWQRIAPQAVEPRRTLAVVLNNQVGVLAARGEFAAARKTCERVRHLYDELWQSHPAEHLIALARVELNLGILAIGLKDYAAAEAAFSESRQRLDAAENHIPQIQRLHLAGMGLIHRGRMRREQQRYTEAQADFDAAVARLTDLVRLAPDRALYRFNLASAYLFLGSVELRLNRDEPARTNLTTAREKLAALLLEHPETPVYRKYQADVLFHLGEVAYRAKDYDQASRWYRLARPLARETAGMAPGAAADVAAALDAIPEAYTAAMIATRLGVVAMLREQPAEAARELREAVQLRRATMAAGNTTADHRVALAGDLVNLAGVLPLEPSAERLALVDEAVAVLAPVVETKTHPQAITFLRNAHGRRAETLEATRRFAAAATAWEQCIALYDRGVPLTNELHYVRCLVFADRAQEAHERVRRWTPALARRPDLQFATGWFHACVNAVKPAEADAERAVELIAMALRQGFKPPAPFTLDHADLIDLRTRIDAALP